jgi:Lipocalin-like domain
MKNIIAILLTLSVITAAAQSETFDLVTYSPPKGWKKHPAESAIQFIKEDTAKGIYCVITLYKAVPGTANSKENFDLAWASLVKEMVTVSAAPEMQPPATENGWEAQSGYAAFEKDGTKGIVILATSTSFEKMGNIIILTNTDVYEKEMTGFLESISFKKPEAVTQPTPPATNDNNAIIGTWGISVSDQESYAVNNGINGYSSRQYTFNANGTYHFIIKTFRYTSDKLLLTKENGTYQISGTDLIINPQTSVIEAWSKKDGVDKWGKLLSSQNRTLEKITYQFTKHYFSGIQQWNLVLQAGKATQRDGPFSTNTTFSNAWYYAPASANNPVIELPGGQQISAEEVRTDAREKKEQVQQTASTNNAPILGTWGISMVVPYRSGTESTAGNTITQYTFKANGTYTFYIKTFRYSYEKLLLTKEYGTYQISGTTITIKPQNAVLEAWSKKDGTDNWGKLLSTQKKRLEKITYRFFTKDSGLEPVLVLQASKTTQRDGPFNNSARDAWLYPVVARSTVIKLPTD